VPETAYRFESCRGHSPAVPAAEHDSRRAVGMDNTVGYRSGQPGQTVNLLALRLRRFESFPHHLVQVDIDRARSSVG
jgi:hypothetical protein